MARKTLPSERPVLGICLILGNIHDHDLCLCSLQDAMEHSLSGSADNNPWWHYDRQDIFASVKGTWKLHYNMLLKYRPEGRNTYKKKRRKRA